MTELVLTAEVVEAINLVLDGTCTIAQVVRRLQYSQLQYQRVVRLVQKIKKGKLTWPPPTEVCLHAHAP